MLNNKKLGLGIEDFKEAITLGYYYIDKSKFIEEILLDGADIKLFCRPRRFGKTLNMSTIRYFFDIKNREENRKLFNGLYIENSPMMSEQGKYPVIFISFKGINTLTFESLIERIKDRISTLYRSYSFLIEKLNEFEIEKFKNITNSNIDIIQLESSLLFLSEVLYKYYNEKVIILIDEYDIPLLNAYENGYYNEAINFFKGFYGDVLKTNKEQNEDRELALKDKYGLRNSDNLSVCSLIKEAVISRVTSSLKNLKFLKENCINMSNLLILFLRKLYPIFSLYRAELILIY